MDDRNSATANQASERKFLGIQFECCGTYARIYFNARLNCYNGNCPRCYKAIKIMVDPEKATTNSRFFRAK